MEDGPKWDAHTYIHAKHTTTARLADAHYTIMTCRQKYQNGQPLVITFTCVGGVLAVFAICTVVIALALQACVTTNVWALSQIVKLPKLVQDIQ